MTKLSVNLNKVALLRNTRDINLPSVVDAAKTCIAAGANGITVHPRPDQRHIRTHDVYDLLEVVSDVVEYNIEGNPFFPEFMQLVKDVVPTQCTLVPDTEGQRTSDHGWDLNSDTERLSPIIDELKSLGIRVALFMDETIMDFEPAAKIGADRVELYTERYATAYEKGDWQDTFDRYADAAKRAQKVGLGVNAGHDLNLDNIAQFCTIPNILECSIGHALTAEALYIGLEKTVQEYLKRMQG
ncbi:MAG: pyridoxine 5'-phosphate synthase [Gammaproteobacteria bacterium]|nr:pyridoxine 5'-phosphate synthase [Gammaproteobacteria bacterium]